MAETSKNFFDRIDAGIKEAVRLALLEHKRAGRSIFISRDGEVVEVPPEEIPVDDEAAA